MELNGLAYMCVRSMAPSGSAELESKASEKVFEVREVDVRLSSSDPR
jgi:hypothetical protein